MLRRTMLTVAAVIDLLGGGTGLALAQTSPLPGPQSTPPAQTAPASADPELSAFRNAYTTGDGLAYVVINDEKGERIYRYGDASRLAAKRDTRGYMLFTCASPHVFLQQKPEDKEALKKAKVVRTGEPGFAELDAKYLSGCRNPLVKSAIPNKQS